MSDYFDKHRQIINVEFEYGGHQVRTIEVRREPLFGSYSSLISEGRKAKPDPSEKTTYTKEQMKTLARDIRNMMNSQPIPDDETLERIVDEKLQQYTQEEEKRKREKCPFCYPQVESVTPEPRKYHGVTTVEDANFELAPKPSANVISVPNLYPFTKPHYVTIFSMHKPDLEELSYEDLINYIESGCEIAEEIKEMEGIRGMWDFINWGPEAAASQPHPHAQRGGIPEEMITEVDMEIERYRILQSLEPDPFSIYMNRIRESDLFGFENEQLFIHAPFAPKFPDEVIIMCKEPIDNILDLSKEDRKILASSMLGVFHMLRRSRGVTDLNVVTHQGDLNNRNTGFHAHWHIFPRNLNKLGGIEMIDSYVVTIYPEDTAAAIREWYNRPH